MPYSDVADGEQQSRLLWRDDRRGRAGEAAPCVQHVCDVCIEQVAGARCWRALAASSCLTLSSWVPLVTGRDFCVSAAAGCCGRNVSRRGAAIVIERGVSRSVPEEHDQEVLPSSKAATRH